ncbi:hypothetical protein [Streptomyces tubercidicus]|uniref:hypothetical protein n=1 Tax=Streptomyces tubercidicus TaxID=47759 RepID=UPI003F5CAA20
MGPNLPLWHLQLMVPPETSPTTQPAWVQMAKNALPIVSHAAERPLVVEFYASAPISFVASGALAIPHHVPPRARRELSTRSAAV